MAGRLCTLARCRLDTSSQSQSKEGLSLLEGTGVSGWVKKTHPTLTETLRARQGHPCFTPPEAWP